MATIYRNLLINTPLEFYNVIKDRPFIVNSDRTLSQFRDFISLYLNGCNCSRQETYNNALNIYKKLNRLEPITVSQIKESVQCDKIIFTLSGAFIFEI